jgi:hypothetical protein
MKYGYGSKDIKGTILKEDTEGRIWKVLYGREDVAKEYEKDNTGGRRQKEGYARDYTEGRTEGRSWKELFGREDVKERIWNGDIMEGRIWKEGYARDKLEGKYGRDDRLYCQYEGKAKELEHEGRNIKTRARNWMIWKGGMKGGGGRMCRSCGENIVRWWQESALTLLIYFELYRDGCTINMY